jgi:hypothetical protein
MSNYQYKGTQESTQIILLILYEKYIIYSIMHSSPVEMDARLHTIKDPDARMVNKVMVDGKEVKVSRIEGLKPNEIGYLKITNFKQDGLVAEAKTVGTILEVTFG